MLTPLDIHNKVFGRAFRGYRMDEVDAFLDEVIRDVETQLREITELRETVARMGEEAAKNREISTTLEKTMILAQKVYEEETIRANKEAEILIWDAEKKGEQLVQEAQKEVLDTRQRIERLRLYEKQLYLKHKGFLEFQMELLDGYKDKETLLTDSDMELLTSGARERDLYGENGEHTDTLPDIVTQEADASGDDVGAEERMYIVVDGAQDMGEGQIPPEYVGLANKASGMSEGVEAGVEASAETDVEAVEASVDASAEASVDADVDAEGKAQADEEQEQTFENAQASFAADADADAEANVTESAEARAVSAENDGAYDNGAQPPMAGIIMTDGNRVEAAYTATDEDAQTDSDSPFAVDEQVQSMEQVVLLAQKMEEALKALDTIYGTDDE